MVQVENIKKSFGALQVLKGISLSVSKGEVISIVGASGAGKTTLLEIMGTLSLPDSGALRLDGVDVFSLSRRELAKLRNQKLGFVFQFHHLLPEFTALENVCIPAFIAGASRRKTEERAKELLSYLNLEHRMTHKPAEMSGGEQQRVAIARALINRPAVILADEPSGNLDSRNKQELHALLFKLRAEMGQTIVVVTHDEELADMCDRKIVMSDGQIVENGEWRMENLQL
ncbi:MAG: ABC transporter ATP-binding protein [Prevotellaceae bacterium]|nr:ABC transporter ATP-binding protein [Prevotellaceae bacterium]